MVEYRTRIYHCHKLRKNVTIQEEYEIKGDLRFLLRSECPLCKYKDDP